MKLVKCVRFFLLLIGLLFFFSFFKALSTGKAVIPSAGKITADMALHNAAARGETEKVLYYISHGKNPNDYDKDH